MVFQVSKFMQRLYPRDGYNDDAFAVVGVGWGSEGPEMTQ